MKDHACPYFITKTNHLFFPSCFSSFIFISFFVLWHHSVSLFNCDCASFYNKVKSFHNWCRPLSFISFFSFLFVSLFFSFVLFFLCCFVFRTYRVFLRTVAEVRCFGTARPTGRERAMHEALPKKNDEIVIYLFRQFINQMSK